MYLYINLIQNLFIRWSVVYWSHRICIENFSPRWYATQYIFITLILTEYSRAKSRSFCRTAFSQSRGSSRISLNTKTCDFVSSHLCLWWYDKARPKPASKLRPSRFLGAIMSLIQVCASLAVVLLVGLALRARNRPLYPPSPPRKWIIGNLLDMPRTVDTKKFTLWKDQYGVYHSASFYTRATCYT